MRKALFVGIHLCALSAILVGVTWSAVVLCLTMYFIRMFGITAGFHRYFSHRSYKTSRPFQFILALLGTSAAQKGPLWWAASHRHHHRHSDTEQDLHSPSLKGIWWAHVGWILSPEYDDADVRLVNDLAHFPELQLIEKYHFLPPLLLIPAMLLVGYLLPLAFPSIHLTPLSAVCWGAFMSTVILYHGTFAINSLAHVLGRQRFETGDESRNSLLLSLLTLGEGWHNNHHRYPSSERQGFYWWEIDITHYVLKLLSFFGIVWDLKGPPAKAFDGTHGRTTQSLA